MLIKLNVYEQPIRVLKLRNPWITQTWTGRASEFDTQFWSKISPECKQLMGFKQADNRIIFMLWEDFIKYFTTVNICQINDNANFLNI